MAKPMVGVEVRPCEVCGTPFRLLPCNIRKALQRGHNLPRFCSSICQHASYRGSGNPKWRGGRVPQPSGYVYAYAPEHPYRTLQGYVMEHRLVVEKHLGRYLTPVEEVHHRNHIRDDNRLENLQVMPSKTAHRIHHAYYEDHPCGTCGALIARSVAHRRRFARGFCSKACSAAEGSRIAKAAADARRLQCT